MSAATERDPRPDAEPNPYGITRHAHAHTHPGEPYAHNASGSSHEHAHFPRTKLYRARDHHPLDQHAGSDADPRVVAITDDLKRIAVEHPDAGAYELTLVLADRFRAAKRGWAGRDADPDLREPSGGMANGDDQAVGDAAVRQPDRQPDAGAPAVPGGGAVRGYPLTVARADGTTVVASTGLPVSHGDPLDRHFHSHVAADGGTLTHSDHGGNYPGHSHAGYGERVEPAGHRRPADPPPAAGGAPRGSADAEQFARAARRDAADLTGAPDGDAAEDRRRAAALEKLRSIEKTIYQSLQDSGQYPRKDGDQEGP